MSNGSRCAPNVLGDGHGFLMTIARAVTYVVPDVHWLLRRSTRDAGSVLDIGCGSETSPYRFVDAPRGQKRVGVDKFEASVDKSRRAKIHDAYLVADVFDTEIEPGSYDCVTAMDVIEHFSKADGFRLLDRMEQIARRRVIVFTPNGFLPQEAFDGNEAQRHLSGWSEADFRARGYRVYGANGLKPLRGEYAYPTVKPLPLGLLLALASQPVALGIPRAAFHLFAVKDLTAR